MKKITVLLLLTCFITISISADDITNGLKKSDITIVNGIYVFGSSRMILSEQKEFSWGISNISELGSTNIDLEQKSYQDSNTKCVINKIEKKGINSYLIQMSGVDADYHLHLLYEGHGLYTFNLINLNNPDYSNSKIMFKMDGPGELYDKNYEGPQLNYNSILTSLHFLSPEKCIYEDGNVEPQELKYDYSSLSSVPFIEFENQEKFVFLYNDYFAIASPLNSSYETSDKRPYVHFFTDLLPASTRILKTSFGNLNTTVQSSSFLEESNIQYNAENVLSPFGIPWVEGVSGDGIGEYLEMQWYDDEIYNRGVYFIAICSGYISYEKPYLYEYNSRPKTIEIHDLDNDLKKNL